MLHDFTSTFWAYTVDGLTVGAIYALVALGYTMVYGVLRLINFAHSEIFMIGTFGSLTVIQAFGLHGPFGGFALVGVLLLCMAAAMVAAGGVRGGSRVRRLPAVAQEGLVAAGGPHLRDRRVAVPAGALRDARHPRTRSGTVAAVTTSACRV